MKRLDAFLLVFLSCSVSGTSKVALADEQYVARVGEWRLTKKELERRARVNLLSHKKGHEKHLLDYETATWVQEALLRRQARALGISVNSKDIEEQLARIARDDGLDVNAWLSWRSEMGFEPALVRENVEVHILGERVLSRIAGVVDSKSTINNPLALETELARHEHAWLNIAVRSGVDIEISAEVTRELEARSCRLRW